MILTSHNSVNTTVLAIDVLNACSDYRKQVNKNPISNIIFMQRVVYAARFAKRWWYITLNTHTNRKRDNIVAPYTQSAHSATHMLT